ncbi:MAG: hypothetical protein ABIT08_00880 [Bacteroidia bacterium]
MKHVMFTISVLLMLAACSKNKNDYSVCPTADNIQVSYARDIKPIIDNNCSYSGCHTSPPGDSTLVYEFTTYRGTKKAIGSFYNRIIRPVDDPLHMPKRSSLDSCDLVNMIRWIQNGAPEN